MVPSILFSVKTHGSDETHFDYIRECQSGCVAKKLAKGVAFLLSWWLHAATHAEHHTLEFLHVRNRSVILLFLNSHIDALNPSMMVFGDGALRWSWGSHGVMKSDALRIRAPVRRNTRALSLTQTHTQTHSALWRRSKKTAVCKLLPLEPHLLAPGSQNSSFQNW